MPQIYILKACNAESSTNVAAFFDKAEADAVCSVCLAYQKTAPPRPNITDETPPDEVDDIYDAHEMAVDEWEEAHPVRRYSPHISMYYCHDYLRVETLPLVQGCAVERVAAVLDGSGNHNP